MPKTIKRGAGARLGGIEKFLNLKRVFDDAKRGRQWEEEKLLYGERKKDVRLGETLESRERIARMGVAARLAGAGGTQYTAGERKSLNQILETLSTPGFTYEDPTTGATQANTRRDAERFVRLMGMDPTDERVSKMIQQYPTRAQAGKQRLKDLPGEIGTFMLTGPAGLSALKRGRKHFRKKEVAVPKATSRTLIPTEQEVVDLIGAAASDPNALSRLEELEALGYISIDEEGNVTWLE